MVNKKVSDELRRLDRKDQATLQSFLSLNQGRQRDLWMIAARKAEPNSDHK